jgi:hypothetical protein
LAAAHRAADCRKPSRREALDRLRTADNMQ